MGKKHTSMAEQHMSMAKQHMSMIEKTNLWVKTHVYGWNTLIYD